MADSYSPPSPRAEHEWLARGVGTWDVECSYFFQPGEDPIHATGIDRVEMIGPYWRRGSLTADLFGSPLAGCATLGFDPVKDRFVCTWIDSSNPYLYLYEGELDPKAGRLVLEGTNLDPSTSKPAKYRSVEVADGRDARSLELFVTAPGSSEMLILTYSYKRRSDDPAAP